MTDTAIGITPLSWPDPVTISVNYLRAALAALPAQTYPNAANATVSNRVPESRPVPLVRIQREGGVATQTHDRARLIVECWHGNDAQAASLCGTVRDVLRIMPGVRGGWTVSRVLEESGPTAIADPESDLPRYVFVIEVTVRAKPRS